ncbi:MAG TPA: pyridoxal-dependent decarboxylase [Thermoplasmata archaeon]|nr:pyridoxal-dependent decarboxylase [Thermoplasmata archaeon]
MQDPDFVFDKRGLVRAIELLGEQLPRRRLRTRSATPRLPAWIPSELPERGLGPERTLERLAPLVVGGALPLDDPGMLAHMDPPTPWITWAVQAWTAALNQNLLHPELSPAAGPVERRVVEWLAPYFRMDGGHMVPGSSVANLTALWAARELRGIRRVVASEAAHFSVRKAARILGLEFRAVPVGPDQRLDPAALPNLRSAALVLTAGTTAVGAIDPLRLETRAAWVHVDAAWAGPLRFGQQYRARLTGIEGADSVGFSGHKWLFQPKDSAVVLFRDARTAHRALSFEAPYLSAPHVGVLGSHGGSAGPLLATLLAWGRSGLAARVERCMAISERLGILVGASPKLELWRSPTAGIVLWRRRDMGSRRVAAAVRGSYLSTVPIGGLHWLRCVVANPMADPQALVDHVLGVRT